MRLSAMDFSKAFDSVNHELLSYKLKDVPLNQNGIKAFLRIVHSALFTIVFKDNGNV